jgi:hypothetical protein
MDAEANVRSFRDWDIHEKFTRNLLVFFGVVPVDFIDRPQADRYRSPLLTSEIRFGEACIQSRAIKIQELTLEVHYRPAAPSNGDDAYRCADHGPAADRGEADPGSDHTGRRGEIRARALSSDPGQDGGEGGG